MNAGTKIRTVLAIIAAINQALVTIGEIDLGNEIANTIYGYISLVFLVVSMASSHYYNNDFTEEACKATGKMRLIKAQAKGDIPAEDFTIEEEGEIHG